MSKKLKLLFITSLILNALLVSFIGGKIYQHKTMKHSPAPLVDLLEKASISKDERTALITKLNKSSPKNNMKDRRDWENKAHTVLTAEIFDEAAYRAHLEDRFLNRQPHKAEMINTMAEIAGALNQEERTKMARILKKQSKRHQKTR